MRFASCPLRRCRLQPGLFRKSGRGKRQLGTRSVLGDEHSRRLGQMGTSQIHSNTSGLGDHQYSPIMVTKNEALKSGCTMISMMGFGEPNQFDDDQGNLLSSCSPPGGKRENTEYINRIHQHTSRALNVTSVCLEGMHDPGLQIDRNLSE